MGCVGSLQYRSRNSFMVASGKGCGGGGLFNNIKAPGLNVRGTSWIFFRPDRTSSSTSSITDKDMAFQQQIRQSISDKVCEV